jgi:hypothetical protein
MAEGGTSSSGAGLNEPAASGASSPLERLTRGLRVSVEERFTRAGRPGSAGARGTSRRACSVRSGKTRGRCTSASGALGSGRPAEAGAAGIRVAGASKGEDDGARARAGEGSSERVVRPPKIRSACRRASLLALLPLLVSCTRSSCTSRTGSSSGKGSKASTAELEVREPAEEERGREDLISTVNGRC